MPSTLFSSSSQSFFGNSVRRFLRNSLTWSPLAEALNLKPPNSTTMFNVLKEKGLFNIPELKKYQGFYILEKKCKSQAKKLINEAIGKKRERKLVEIFDELSDTLCKVADLAEFVRHTHPEQTFIYTAGKACVSVASLVEKLNTNIKLYNALKNVIDKGDCVPMDEMDKHVVKLFLFDFEQCGIHLQEEERKKIVSLNEKLLYVGQQFLMGTYEPKKIEEVFIPVSVREFFSTEDGKVTVTGFNLDTSNHLAREIAYKIFLDLDKRQEILFLELLTTRNKLAKICGFSCYAERALKGNVFNSPKLVLKFLTDLSEAVSKRAQKDFDVMNEMKQIETPNVGPLAAWDVPYFTQKLKKEELQLTFSMYRSYFSLGACMEGLSNLFYSLFGIILENEELDKGEVWVNDIYKIVVRHESEGVLGYIYCDFYERKGKTLQESHFTIRGGRLMRNGKYQLPIVAVVLSLPPPVWNRPSLLTVSMLENLYHEMGHALHSMLGRTKYQHVTGTRCSTDFAEVPSILMEYFASDPRVIKTFARHYKTKQIIPESVLNRICTSKNIFIASEMQLQIFYSILDQIYHGEHPLKGSTTDILKEAQNKYYQLPYVEKTALHLRFSHFVGYGAKYYSYLVSKALASCIWQTYFEKDPFSREEGERYRWECLAHGGSKPPSKLVSDYLKMELNIKHLVDFLVKEIDNKTKNIHLTIKEKYLNGKVGDGR